MAVGLKANCWRMMQSYKHEQVCSCLQPNIRRYIMWTKPAATEMRFGFEVTMYVCNR